MPVHGFKYGFEWNDISSTKGSEVNDVIEDISGTTKTNFSGGILGGLSNGNDIYCEVVFKPLQSTIYETQKSINKKGRKVEFKAMEGMMLVLCQERFLLLESMMKLYL